MTPHDDLIRLREEIAKLTDDCFDAEAAGDHVTARGKLLLALYAALERQQQTIAERDRLIEQLCDDLNGAHDEICKTQGLERPQDHDWPEWTPQANSIRWAEKMLGKTGLSKAARRQHQGPDPSATAQDLDNGRGLFRRIKMIGD